MKAPFVALAAAVTIATAGCAAPSPGMTAVGTVDDTIRTVTMPNLSVASVNLDAGFSTTPAGAEPTTAANATATTYGFGSAWTVATVRVQEGQRVRTGQVLATIDSTTLKAQVAVAEADRAVTESQVGVLSGAIDKLDTKADDLATARSKVRGAITKLANTLAGLKKAQPQLAAARSDLAAKKAQAENLLTHYPPVTSPGLPTKEQLRASIAALTTAIAGLDAKLTQIRTAIPTLTSGLVTARAAATKLAKASATVADARSQLHGLHDLAVIAADGADLPVELARVQLDRATLTAPSDGVVVTIAAPGARLAPGAAIATIRPAGDSTVTAWLSPDQRARSCVGDPAQISGDWMASGQNVVATLTTISPTSQYPPSSTTTEQTHLTRAVKVLFTTSAALPAGVPVEISLNGCRPAAGSSEQEK